MHAAAAAPETPPPHPTLGPAFEPDVAPTPAGALGGGGMVRRTRKAPGACCTSTLCSTQLQHWEIPYLRSITFGRDWNLVWNEESSGGICMYIAPFMVAIYVAR